MSRKVCACELGVGRDDAVEGREIVVVVDRGGEAGVQGSGDGAGCLSLYVAVSGMYGYAELGRVKGMQI